ncbi:MAG: hypothetical protein JOY92_05095 [Verrucomicrobia bacterium]|nr:hypothetical protein [Verrucomicrobiota bacterium]
MQQLAHMTGVVLHAELLLDHPGNPRRGPDAAVQAVSRRAALDNVTQLLLLNVRQLRRSPGSMSFQQAFYSIGLVLLEPNGNFGARGGQNRRQFAAGMTFRVEHHGSQAFGHAIGSVSFCFPAQTDEALTGPGMKL